MGKDTKNVILNPKLSQRDAFWSEVGVQMAHDEDIVIVVVDMSTPVFDEIRVKYPHRFINVGIAEQNAISVAAGLAMKGKKVFVYAIASFMVLRCFEQIRVNCSIMGLPITIVGVGAGFSYDDSGPTHHLFEDVAVMRSLPGMLIHSVSDNTMSKTVAQKSIELTVPNYVRLDRHITNELSEEQFDSKSGFRIIDENSNQDVSSAIITTGYMNKVAVNVSKEVKILVVDVYQIPCNIKKLFDSLIEVGIKKIYVLEENVLPGGLGSYVLEMSNPTPIEIELLAMDHKWVYEYGGREANQKLHGIDAQSLIRKISGDE